MTTPAEQEPGGTPAQEAAYQIYGSFFLTPAEPMARGPFNHIVAIIQAAIDESVPKWQTIETAPKAGIGEDKIHVILYTPRRGVTFGFWHQPGNPARPGFWQTSHSVAPTHWMPLPQPPKEAPGA